MAPGARCGYPHFSADAHLTLWAPWAPVCPPPLARLQWADVHAVFMWSACGPTKRLSKTQYLSLITVLNLRWPETASVASPPEELAKTSVGSLHTLRRRPSRPRQSTSPRKPLAHQNEPSPESDRGITWSIRCDDTMIQLRPLLCCSFPPLHSNMFKCSIGTTRHPKMIFKFTLITALLHSLWRRGWRSHAFSIRDFRRLAGHSRRFCRRKVAVSWACWLPYESACMPQEHSTWECVDMYWNMYYVRTYRHRCCVYICIYRQAEYVFTKMCGCVRPRVFLLFFPYAGLLACLHTDTHTHDFTQITAPCH